MPLFRDSSSPAISATRSCATSKANRPRMLTPAPCSHSPSRFSLPQQFPPVIPLATLAGVLVLTLIVIRGPPHRATRIRPAAALRYQ